MVDRERKPEGPPLEDAPHALADEPAVDVHPFAVEWRRHEPAFAQVALAVEDEQGMLAEDGSQDLAGRLAAAKRLGVPGVDVTDRVGVAAEDVRASADQAEGEPVTPAPRAHLDGLQRPEREAKGLEQGWSRWTGGQRGHRRDG